MLDKLEAIYTRYKEIEEQMNDPQVTADMKRYVKLSKDYKDLQPVVKAYHFFLDEESIIQFRWDVRANSSLTYLYIDNVKCIVPQEYDISFYVGDELKETKKVSEGEIPEYTGDPLIKESSETHDYFFAGWNPKLVPATENASYTAVFDSSVIYKIPEGETVLIADFETGEFTSAWGGVFYYYSDLKLFSVLKTSLWNNKIIHIFFYKSNV